MKKRLVKTHSAPESLPRIPNGQVDQGQPQERPRHHSASDTGQFGPVKKTGVVSVNNLSLQLHGRIPTRIMPTPFPLMRSATFDKRPVRRCRPMLTILQTEFETDPAVSSNDSSECTPISVDSGHSQMSSRSGITFTHDPVLNFKSPTVERNCPDSETVLKSSSANMVVHPGYTSAPTLHQQHRHLRLKRRPPQTPSVSPVGPMHDYQLVVEDHHSEIIPYSRDDLYHCEQRWEEGTECSENERSSAVTCPVLTKEVLSSGVQGHVMRKQDRVFDWLTSCDNDVRNTSLPPHLPDISSLKRYNTSVA